MKVKVVRRVYNVRKSREGNQQQDWISVIRRDAAESHVVLHRPVRWRLLRRIWNVGLPYGVWGREVPF